MLEVRVQSSAAGNPNEELLSLSEFGRQERSTIIWVQYMKRNQKLNPPDGQNDGKLNESEQNRALSHAEAIKNWNRDIREAFHNHERNRTRLLTMIDQEVEEYCRQFDEASQDFNELKGNTVHPST